MLLRESLLTRIIGMITVCYSGGGPGRASNRLEAHLHTQIIGFQTSKGPTAGPGEPIGLARHVTPRAVNQPFVGLALLEASWAHVTLVFLLDNLNPATKGEAASCDRSSLGPHLLSDGLLVSQHRPLKCETVSSASWDSLASASCPPCEFR